MSVFYLASWLPPAAVSLWPDFAGLDHYSCRSLSPREQFIPPLQKDAVPPTTPKTYTYALLKLCLWMSDWCDGRFRGSAVSNCDSEDAALCIKFKACESETERLRASLQLSGCRVASSRFSMKTNSKKKNKQHRWKYWVCERLLLFMPAATSSLHKAPARNSFFYYFTFRQCSFYTVFQLYLAAYRGSKTGCHGAVTHRTMSQVIVVKGKGTDTQSNNEIGCFPFLKRAQWVLIEVNIFYSGSLPVCFCQERRCVICGVASREKKP